MEILIVRHAEALDMDGTDILTDAERPLSQRGLKQAKRLRKSLKKLKWSPDFVLTSPLVRAKHTAQLVFPKLVNPSKTYFEKDELKAGASPEIIVSALNDLAFEKIALFGHMPDLAILTSWLLGYQGCGFSLDKCGAALLQLEGNPRFSSTYLRWLITPEWKARG